MLKYLQISEDIYASKIKCNNISNLSSSGLAKKCVCIERKRKKKCT